MVKRLFSLTALIVTLTTGCATIQLPPPTEKTDTVCIAPGTWYAPAQGQPLTTQNVLARLKDTRVVMLGETHIIADHHRWQLQVLTQLYAQNPDLVLGFEAFPRRVQAVLDQWVAGKLSEAEFLKQSEWKTVWSFDANLYLPLFHFARLNGVPMVALNVDRSLIQKVSKKGWKAVPQAERLGLKDPAPPSDGYLAMLGRSYGHHDNGNGKTNGAPKAPGLSDPRFARFVDAQLTWDVAMGQAIAARLKQARSQNRTPQLVAIVGRGHLDYGYGVPHQLAALGVRDVAVLSPWDQMRPCADLKTTQGPAIADAVFGMTVTQDFFPPDPPKLGVLIENNPDGGVRVIKVQKGSIAETSALQPGDIITFAAGQPTATTQDLIALVKVMSPGTWLPLNIKRDDRRMEIIARFPVQPPRLSGKQHDHKATHGARTDAEAIQP